MVHEPELFANIKETCFYIEFWSFGEKGKYCLEYTQIFTNKLEKNSI